MFRTEQRKHERYTLDRHPGGEIFLRVGEMRHPVGGINDISSSGISIFLRQDIPVPSPVTIEYADTKLKLEVYGTITRCASRVLGAEEARSDVKFIVGISLLSPLLLLSALQKH